MYERIIIAGCPTVVFRYDEYNLTGSPNSIHKDTDGNFRIGSYNSSMVKYVYNIILIK